jgi:Carboxypeptidase regulatory-like domain
MHLDAWRRRLWASTIALLICATSGLLSQQTAKPEAPRPMTGIGAISGIVSDSASGVAIAGAVVSLSGGITLRCVTDSKGRFFFRDLPAAPAYSLRATKPGYVTAGQRGAVTRALTDGEWISDVKIRLSRPGGISGVVVDEVGEPVVNVPVTVFVRVPFAGMLNWARGLTVRTDDRGYYRIAGLPRGAFIVSVPSVQSAIPPETSRAAALGREPVTMFNAGTLPRIAGIDVAGAWLAVSHYAPPPADGEHRLAYPTMYYPSVTNFSAAAPVDLADGEEKRSIDFTLRPVRTARVLGRVIGPPNVLAGLVVRLLQEGAEQLGMGTEQATALVEADGSFALIGVPAGRYVLDARKSVAELGTSFGWSRAMNPMPGTPGFVMSGSLTQFESWVPGELSATTLVSRYSGDRDGYAARVPLRIGAEDVSGLEVTLQRGVTISGRVVRDDGEPFKGALNVSAQPANGDALLGGVITDRQTSRNPPDTFAVTGLHRGEYFLRVSAGLLSVKSITADAEYTDKSFDVRTGNDITNVLVTLTDKAAKLTGTVRSRDGAPSPEAAIVLFPAQPSMWTNYGGQSQRIKAVMYLGGPGFLIQRIPAGEYYVIAVDLSAPDIWQDPRFFPAAAPLATRVTIGWGTAVVQDLTLQQVILK